MTVAELNEILGRELGRNPRGEPLFKWEWTEDLVWPASSTGRKVANNKDYSVPIIGTGVEEEVTVAVVEPEYKPRRMTDKYHDQWIITAWCKPEELDGWHHIFPGSDYPVGGYRIHTNVAMKKGIDPGYDETQLFIHAVRDQRKAGFYQSLEDSEAREREKRREVTRDMIGEEIPAFLNFNPGKRGNHVSFGGVIIRPDGSLA
jgi:hypothetical protein